MTEQEFNELKLGDEVERIKPVWQGGPTRYTVVDIAEVSSLWSHVYGSREVAVRSDADGLRYIYAKSNIDKYRVVPKTLWVTP